MLLQSKKPQPRPNRIRNTIASAERAGVAHAEQRRQEQHHADRADVDAAARGVAASSDPPACRRPARRRAPRSARTAPRHARLALAEVELLLQDRRHPVAHDPAAIAGSVKYSTSRMKLRFVEQLAHAPRRGVRAVAARSAGARRIAQQHEQRQRRRSCRPCRRRERPAPAELRRVGDVAGEAADDQPAVDAHLVQARRRATASARDGSR